MKKVHTMLAALLFLAAAQSISAQDAAQDTTYGWQKELIGALNLSQTSFDNWAQGGENSLAWQVGLNVKLVNDQEKLNWANSGQFSFGKTRVGDEDARKSIDEIKVESVLTYKMGILINPYVAVTGETQSSRGFKYSGDTRVEVSNIFDPAYFTQSIGLGYQATPEFKTRLGLAFKQTITSDHPVPYADDPKTPEIEKTRSEVGMESVSDFSQKIDENTLLKSKLELFSNLEAFDEIDVRWDNVLTARVSKYINVNFNVKLFYDKDISDKRQLKQALSLGFSYTFF